MRLLAGAALVPEIRVYAPYTVAKLRATMEDHIYSILAALAKYLWEIRRMAPMCMATKELDVALALRIVAVVSVAMGEEEVEM